MIHLYRKNRYFCSRPHPILILFSLECSGQTRPVTRSRPRTKTQSTKETLSKDEQRRIAELQDLSKRLDVWKENRADELYAHRLKIFNIMQRRWLEKCMKVWDQTDDEDEIEELLNDYMTGELPVFIRLGIGTRMESPKMFHFYMVTNAEDTKDVIKAKAKVDAIGESLEQYYIAVDGI